MKESQIYQEQLDTLSEQLKTELDNTDAPLLYKRSGPSVNTPGFLYWHILRIWDLDLNHIVVGQGADQDAWHRGDYSTKSGYNPDGKGMDRLPGMGLGYSDEEVDGVTVPLEVLHEYHDQLATETRQYLSAADDDALRAELTTRPNVTAAQRMQHLIGHSYGHLGDIRFSKGLLGHTDATYPKK